jgi:tight adherence protein B
VAEREDLGLPLEESLARWGAASASADVRLVADVLALRIGGGLPRVLDGVCTALRERGTARREVRSLTAQARLSGTILGLLPVGFFLFLFIVSRRDMTVAYSTPLGLAAIVAGLVLDGLAFLWIRKLVQVAA